MVTASVLPTGPAAPPVRPADRPARHCGPCHAGRLQELAALAHALVGSKSGLVSALQQAALGRPGGLAVAAGLIDQLPAVQRRRLLGSYSSLLTSLQKLAHEESAA